MNSVSLNRNVTARIQNPLAGIPKQTLFQNVDEFAQVAGMQDEIPLLRKGAQVAQDPPAFEAITELTDEEREALRDEVLHKWRAPRALYVTVILCSIGAAVQGWDQTGSNGANLSWPVDFGVPDTPPATGEVAGVDYDKNSWIVGVVNAGPYIGSAFL